MKSARRDIENVGTFSFPNRKSEKYKSDSYNDDGNDPSLSWMWSDWQTGFSHMIPSLFERLNITMGVAIQAGGNVGLYPRLLSKHFSTVFTFEPDLENFKHLVMNCTDKDNIFPYPCALGHENGINYLNIADYNGQSYLSIYDDENQDSDIIKFNTGDWVQTVSIDSMNFPHCDLIFLDVEHAEYDVLLGAIKTIKDFTPVIIVEHSYKGTKEKLNKLLTSLNYKLEHDFGQDAVYIYDYKE